MSRKSTAAARKLAGAPVQGGSTVTGELACPPVFDEPMVVDPAPVVPLLVDAALVDGAGLLAADGGPDDELPVGGPTVGIG